MARKQQVQIQDNIETEEEFETYIESHKNVLICLEVYTEFCGNCQAMANAVKKGKLEIGGDNIAMAKAVADNIPALSRFKFHSEPAFLFISGGKVTRTLFGANGIKFIEAVLEELRFFKTEEEGGAPVEKYEIADMPPSEAAKREEDQKVETEVLEAQERLRVLTIATRKKRINERRYMRTRYLNYIMFWPHCHQAHYDLYEKWDDIHIQVADKELYQLNEDNYKEALYMSDIEPNEACLHAMFNGQVLVVLFKIMDNDTRDFAHLMRHALYEEIPTPKEDEPPEKQPPLVPAFERYASISKTAREVRRDRYNAKQEKIRQAREEAERLAAERERLAREAEEERQLELKKLEEERRMQKLQGLLPPEPEVGEEGGEEEEGEEEQEEEEMTVPEAMEVEEEMSVPEEMVEAEAEEEVEEEEEFNSDIEVEGEDYIPPGGMFVPGLYSPPNRLAQANGVAFFFPKVVAKIMPAESEFLPQHVLVMFSVDRRGDIFEIVNQYKDSFLNYGFFVGEEPHNMEHVAFTLRQYDDMPRPRRFKDRLALMVSKRRSLPLLQLTGFNPCYISSDPIAGERDCLTLFPVGYGDDYEEEPSVHEEEVVVVEAPVSAGEEEGEEEQEEEDG